jgi:hypothetical protein
MKCQIGFMSCNLPDILVTRRTPMPDAEQLLGPISSMKARIFSKQRLALFDWLAAQIPTVKL